MTDPKTPLEPELVHSTEPECSLEDICNSCRVEAGFVAALVEHGVVDATGGARSEWRFTRASVVRVAKARRLEQLELNPAGIALALELIEEIERLRRRLAAAEQSENGGRGSSFGEDR
jgi:chaperone modulatory protein CbpM